MLTQGTGGFSTLLLEGFLPVHEMGCRGLLLTSASRPHCMQMDVEAGVGYAIVVDGFGGNYGTFDIAITADQVRCKTCQGTASTFALPTCRRTESLYLSVITGTVHRLNVVCNPASIAAGTNASLTEMWAAKHEVYEHLPLRRGSLIAAPHRLGMAAAAASQWPQGRCRAPSTPPRRPLPCRRPRSTCPRRHPPLPVPPQVGGL